MISVYFLQVALLAVLSGSSRAAPRLTPSPEERSDSPASSYNSPGAAGVGSRHHLVCRGFGTWRGWLNLRMQVSLGTMVHWWTGDSLGTSFVTNLHVFCGLRSQDSSGTSTTLAMTLSWHSSTPSSMTQPAPQISTGSFSQAVSPTNLPGCFSTYFVVQDDSYTVLHSSGPWPLHTFSTGL